MPLFKIDVKQGSALECQQRQRDESEHAQALRASAGIAKKTEPKGRASSLSLPLSPLAAAAAPRYSAAVPEKLRRARERFLDEIALREAAMAMSSWRCDGSVRRDADEECRDERYRDEDDDDGTEEKAFVDD